jgi:hypothetical protein
MLYIFDNRIFFFFFFLNFNYPFGIIDIETVFQFQKSFTTPYDVDKQSSSTTIYRIYGDRYNVFSLICLQLIVQYPFFFWLVKIFVHSHEERKKSF